MNNRIGVIGIGKLGLSFALLAAQRGYTVYGQDNRAEYIDSLVDKLYSTSEPLIDEYLHSCTSFTPLFSLSTVVDGCDILFCFVATPSLPDGSYDHSAVDDVVSDLQRLHVQGIDLSSKVLVIGCTTMPGYCDTIAQRLETAGVTVVYNPEFIAQGSIIHGLRTADMVLIGCDSDPAYLMLQGIYRTIMTVEPKFNRMSRTAAEITKISINCYLTMKIAYANMIGEIAINSGQQEYVGCILDAIGSDSRIGSKYLGYGFGYGGPCLPRDMTALGVHAKSVGLIPLIQDSIDGCNNNHAVYLKNYYSRQNPDTTVPFLFTQLTYKTGTDMLVESQQYRLCKDLLAAGYSVDITESPAVVQQVQKELVEHADRITYGTVTNGYKIEI